MYSGTRIQADRQVASDRLSLRQAVQTVAVIGFALLTTAAEGFPTQAGWPVQVPGPGDLPAVADIDNDGGRELAMIFKIGNDLGQAVVYDETGQMEPGWPQEVAGIRTVPGAPAVVDLDGDGFLEIVHGTYECWVYAWHYDGTPVAGWPRFAGATSGDEMWAHVIAADVDSDGAPEIVTASAYASVHVFDPEGTEKPGWPVLLPDDMIGGLAAGDLNGDGRWEIVAVGITLIPSQHTVVRVWEADGQSLSGWPVHLTDGDADAG